MICCTETHITSEISDGELKLNDFDIIRSDSMTRHSGGIVVYIKKGTRYVCKKDVVFTFNNILIVDVLNGSCRGTWFFIYHSPNTSHSEFLSKLNELIDEYAATNLPIRLIGDFNINVHENNPVNTYKDRLRQITSDYNLKLIVNDFTRITRDSKSKIDLLYVNDEIYTVTVDNINQIADHGLLIVNKERIMRKYNNVDITDRSDYEKEKFKTIFRSKFSESEFEQKNLNEKLNYLELNIQQSVNELVKKKTISVQYSNIWFNQELRALRTERSVAREKANISNDDEDWQNYRRIRNKYNKKLNQIKDTFIKSEIDNNRHDPKKLWRKIKNLSNGERQSIDYIKLNNDIINDPSMMCESLNNYFVNSIIEINESIAKLPYNEPDRSVVQWTEFKQINMNEMNELLNDMKSKAGINNVNIDVIKHAVECCGQLFLNVFNELLKYGICPESWKCTYVTPIPKIKNSHRAEDMRPINTAPTMDKILQNIVKDQLNEHIANNNIITDIQSAFRRHHSCETSLNLVLHQWIEQRDRGKNLIIVFLDLKRAFETVDRNILLQKLRKVGITGRVHSWFQSWLTNRTQSTVINGVASEQIEVNIGIPQGTPLSCALFNLYVNELAFSVRNCVLNLFADDALVWVACDQLQEGAEKINEDLESIAKYFKMCSLKLNTEKTKCMFIKKSNTLEEPNVTIENVLIEKVSVMKYLGILIDEKLKFNEHMNFLVKKMASKVSFLSRNKKKFSFETRVLLYEALIQPTIDYCSTILILMNDGQMERLQIIQNRAMRALLNCDYYTSRETMLNQLNMFSVRQRVCYNCLVFIHKAKTGLLPDYLSSLLVPVGEGQPYLLRRNNDLRTTVARSTTGQKCLFYKGVQMYNRMTSEVNVQNMTLNTVKMKIRQYVHENIEI